jgi:TonB family protein
MADLQRRIKRAWFPPLGQESRPVTVLFKIHSQGELSDLRIENSSGVAIADQVALQAVTNAAPFRPLPEGSPNVVPVEFKFDYNTSTSGKGAASADNGSKTSAEATMVQSVNSAGTVQVNNLANLEVWLTKAGNLLCWGLMIWGVIIARKGKGKVGGILITCGGVLLIVVGLAAPVINRMIASARNAGLLK